MTYVLVDETDGAVAEREVGAAFVIGAEAPRDGPVPQAFILVARRIVAGVAKVARVVPAARYRARADIAGGDWIDGPIDWLNGLSLSDRVSARPAWILAGGAVEALKLAELRKRFP